MKFVTSREVRSNPAKLWKIIEQGEAIITVNGKPRAIVLPADEGFEETLSAYRQAKAEIALEKLRIYSLEKGLDKLSDEEIDEEISNTRRDRARY